MHMYMYVYTYTYIHTYIYVYGTWAREESLCSRALFWALSSLILCAARATAVCSCGVRATSQTSRFYMAREPPIIRQKSPVYMAREA